MSEQPLRNPECQACDLYQGCKNVCLPGDGPLDAEVLVLGIAP